MILDLKNIFLNENEKLSVKTEINSMDDITSNGVDHAFQKPVFANITVQNHAGVIDFEADTELDYHFCCDRCMKVSHRKYAYQFRHILVAALSEESGDDYIEAPDYKLDTDALLRDDILLELPSKFLCKESCKGLCPKCGKNLNEGGCGCDTHEVDPRLAVLKQHLSD